MTKMLQEVIENGTGRSAQVLGRPLAGKTGTTNAYRNAWFVGYSPDYLTVVWTGYDNRKSLGKGKTGARAALPIWIGIMKRILADKPVKKFPIPPNLPPETLKMLNKQPQLPEQTQGGYNVDNENKFWEEIR